MMKERRVVNEIPAKEITLQIQLSGRTQAK